MDLRTKSTVRKANILLIQIIIFFVKILKTSSCSAMKDTKIPLFVTNSSSNYYLKCLMSSP